MHGPRQPREMHDPTPLLPASAPAWLLRRSEREEVNVAISRFCTWVSVALEEGFESQVRTVIVGRARKYDCSAEEQCEEHWVSLLQEHGPRHERIPKGKPVVADRGPPVFGSSEGVT